MFNKVLFARVWSRLISRSIHFRTMCTMKYFYSNTKTRDMVLQTWRRIFLEAINSLELQEKSENRSNTSNSPQDNYHMLNSETTELELQTTSHSMHQSYHPCRATMIMEKTGTQHQLLQFIDSHSCVTERRDWKAG